jgi:UDP-GlcNAc:undecaprenyl-phosphate GlcNAc-1-phosphate transferase
MLEILSRGEALSIQYSGAFIVPFLLTLLLTPLAKRLALKFKIIDFPAEHKFHDSPVPYLGGLAILAALIIAIISYTKTSLELTAILGLAFFLSLIGFIDDHRTISPTAKLIAQILAALGIYLFGVQVKLFHIPLIDITLTILWIVGITNAFNLLDNMDGLSVGTSAICAFFFFVVAAFNQQYLVASLSAALCGACLGFLIYNFSPASIFMGDAGSLFLGFLLAVIGIKLRFTNVKLITFSVPILILGYPIFDTALVTVSRKLHGISAFKGGKDHSSHRLVKMGMSPRLAVITLYLVSVSLGCLALVLSTANAVQGVGILSAVTALSVAGIVIFSQVDVYPNKKD